MTLQNVTISLPGELISEAKHLAVDEGVSLSRFVAGALQQRIQATRTYQAARERQLRMLDHGFPLGTNGQAYSDRAALHER